MEVLRVRSHSKQPVVMTMGGAPGFTFDGVTVAGKRALHYRDQLLLSGFGLICFWSIDGLRLVDVIEIQPVCVMTSASEN